MATARGTWKRRERQAASIFGARRQVGSGSGGRADQTRSDSLHKNLFIETKLRASSATRNLWESTAALAKKEAKTPVLMLYAKNKTGALVVVHEDHLDAMLDEYLAAKAARRDAESKEGEG
jgi:hypothetical protein